MSDVTHRKRGLRFEKSVSWVLPREKKFDFRLLGVALCRVRTWFGVDGKASIERSCLSPYVEKPLNSKVIKSFVPELRSRKCFSCFGIPMFYVYMWWTFYVCLTSSCMAMLHICQKRYVISVVRVRNSLCWYLLLLAFASVKPFSFIKSIHLRST